MLKIFKKKSFWIILVVILAVVGVFAYSQFTKKPAITYTTEAVKRGNLTQTVSATGMVESAHEISLNLKNPTRITSLPFKEGADVKAGQVLATTDAQSINSSIKQYAANLASTKANLEKVKAGASNEDVKLTQEQLTKATNDYTNLLRESDNQIKTLKEKNIDALNNSVFTAQATLNTLYNDLINTETTYNLLVSDSNLQNQVKNSYELAQANFVTVRTMIEAAKAANGDQVKIVAASDSTYDFLNQLNTLLISAYTMGDKIIINNTYTETKKTTIKADVSAQQLANTAALTAVSTARANLVSSANSYQTQIQAASNSVAITQAQLNLKQASPRDFDIAAAQAQVAQAQASLDKAYADAEDYSLKAPIDGKITKINYSIGETPSAANPTIQMLGNERYEIKVDVPESDVTKIRLGEKVTIELDAFGSDHPFSGTVTFIDPAQTIIKDVTYYKATISFNDDSWNDQIKPGMTANITIVSDEKSSILFIPQRAVKIKEAALGAVPVKFVDILVNGQAQERIVEIGLRGDNGLIEIISGLNENEQVITFQK